MALGFGSKQPRNGNGEPAPATPQLVRSRFQEILDRINLVVKYSDEAAGAAAALVHDLEKGLRYFDRLKVDLTQCLEAAAAETPATNQQLEHDIKASIDAKYIPPQYRAPESDASA